MGFHTFSVNQVETVFHVSEIQFHASLSFTENVWNPIVTKVENAKKSITKKFEDAKNAVTGAWGGIEAWFKTNVGDPLGKVADGMNCCLLKFSPFGAVQ